MAAIKYNNQMSTFKLYNHLMQEGTRKITEWFGKAMFEDLHKNGILPNTVTAMELLEHLELTYAQSYDQRRYLERVERDLNSPYDPKQPVETYFMKLQEVRTNAELLGQPYSEKIVMNKALKQFEKHFKKDAYKAERKWNAKTTAEKDWRGFKEYWKQEIHQWETAGTKSSRHANQAVMEHVDSLTHKMTDMESNLSALQAENQSYKEENSALMARQIQFHSALQTEQQRRNGGSSSDDVSTITDYMNQKFDALNSRIADINNRTSGHDERTHTNGQLREEARRRAPDTYKHENDGKGLKFNKYCVHCGVNTTHWTRRCYDLTDEQKKKYRNADFEDTMGGSTKFMERRGKYQRDYGFDSL